MKDGQASETAATACLLRAVHQVLDESPRILEDPIAVGLVPGSTEREIRLNADRFQSSFMQVLRASFVARSRIAEDALERAVSRGVTQYVLLGAGYDTFTHRQPAWAAALRIFEVDHPDSQRAKRARLDAVGHGVPPNVRYCPADLECETVPLALAAAEFDSTRPTFFSWLGVVPYLTQSAVESTLRVIRTCATQTFIALSYVVPDTLLSGADAETVSVSSAAASARGEPWLTRFAPDELEALLISLSFGSVVHFGPDQHESAFSNSNPGGLPVPSFERLVVASGPSEERIH